ncbi:Piezo-type mechanosensitive ion channel component family, partial [Trichomonas vaginalis G3]
MEDSEYELSSEPSTTTASGDEVVDPDKLPTTKSYANIPMPRKKKKDHIIFPIMTIVLLELILPICYLINSISTQSIMGLLNIIILIVNVIITNLTKKSITGHKVILSIELVYNIILLACAATLGYRSDRLTNKALIYLGLDFNNTVVKSPLLTIVVSSIAIFLELVAVVFISKTKPEQMIRLREMFFASMGWIFSADFIWCFCLAYAGASNTSYLFMPLLLYFVYISITMGIIGRPCVPHIMQYVVYGYSILYSMYLFYQVSNIGKIYSIANQIKFVMLANRKYDYLVLSVNIIQIWLSTQLCFAFNRAGKAPKIPAFLTSASDFVLVFSFVGVLVYAVFYPCYISVLWIIIVYITAFFNLNTAKKVFFRVISLIHNFSFSCIYVTLADLYPESKIAPKTLIRLNEVGLYHFKDNFTYTLLGFFLAAILAQIGRIIHYKDDQEENEQENYNNLPDVVEKPKEEKKEFLIVKGIKLCFKWIKLIVVFIFKYFTAAAIIILALTYGYAENQIIYHIVWLIALCISVLGIYYRIIFEFIKFFIGITIITATFFEANGLDFHNIDDFLRKTGLAVPSGYTLAGYLWPYMVILFLTVICTNMSDPIFSLPPTGATL